MPSFFIASARSRSAAARFSRLSIAFFSSSRALETSGAPLFFAASAACSTDFLASSRSCFSRELASFSISASIVSRS
jgi:hypothetical protein